MDNKKKKKRIIILCIVLLIVLIIAIICGFLIPLVVSYYHNSFENIEAVERVEPYVEPEMDESEIAKNLMEEETSDELMYYKQTSDDSDSNSGQSEPSGTFDRYYNYLTSFTETDNAVSVYGKTPIYKVEQKNANIINILVLGTDARDVSKERGRSDSMIVISYNKKTGEIKMISMLRDSLVPIEGHGWNRINAAYSFDGVGLAVNTVNELFGLDIQHFVVIDFTGARDFINYVGGVDVTISQKEADYYSKYSDENIEAGLCHMDGALAMTHMRTRKIDSDFGRTERQREVIVALAEKIVPEKSISEIYDYADYAFKLVKTNLSLTDLFPVLTSVAANKDGLSIESQSVPYSDSFEYKYYNGMAILSFDIQDAQSRINQFLYGN